MRRNNSLLSMLAGFMVAMAPTTSWLSFSVGSGHTSVQKAKTASPVRVLAPTPEQARQAEMKQAREGSGKGRPAWLSCRRRLYNRRNIRALNRAGIYSI